jgi:hypothetical protein
MKKITTSSLLRIGCALLAIAVMLIIVPRPAQADGSLPMEVAKAKTATPTKTRTPTRTATALSGKCKIVSTSPTNYTAYSGKADIDFVWQIKNTGSKTWDMDSYDYKFVSGNKIYKYNSIYNLPKSVSSGSKVKLTVDVKLPSKAGTYYMKWALVSGSTTICSLPAIYVRVK